MLTLHTGVTHHEPDRSTPGLILMSPCGGTGAYLVDYSGAVVHSWTIGSGITMCSKLLPNGNLLVNERAPVRKGVDLTGSGIIREYAPDSSIVWEHHDPYQHHDMQRLSRGGAAYLAYTELDEASREAVLGGRPGTETPVGLCGEAIREIDEDGSVVWERHLTEFGTERFPLHPNANRWSTGHTNTLVELADGNYLVSCKVLNLVLIVNRQTGGIDWHYQNDDMGGQHDAQVLDNGNVLVFANGSYSRDLHHSEVWEINPSTNEVVWQYRAKDNPQSFFSPHIGGCQRLASGNTLVCEGAKGCIFEVTPDGDIVWEYINPYFNEIPGFGQLNWLFRSRHHSPDAPEVTALLS